MSGNVHAPTFEEDNEYLEACAAAWKAEQRRIEAEKKCVELKTQRFDLEEKLIEVKQKEQYAEIAELRARKEESEACARREAALAKVKSSECAISTSSLSSSAEEQGTADEPTRQQVVDGKPSPASTNDHGPSVPRKRRKLERIIQQSNGYPSFAKLLTANYDVSDDEDNKPEQQQLEGTDSDTGSAMDNYNTGANDVPETPQRKVPSGQQPSTGCDTDIIHTTKPKGCPAAAKKTPKYDLGQEISREYFLTDGSTRFYSGTIIRLPYPGKDSYQIKYEDDDIAEIASNEIDQFIYPDNYNDSDEDQDSDCDDEDDDSYTDSDDSS